MGNLLKQAMRAFSIPRRLGAYRHSIDRVFLCDDTPLDQSPETKKALEMQDKLDKETDKQ